MIDERNPPPQGVSLCSRSWRTTPLYCNHGELGGYIRINSNILALLARTYMPTHQPDKPWGQTAGHSMESRHLCLTEFLGRPTHRDHEARYERGNYAKAVQSARGESRLCLREPCARIALAQVSSKTMQALCKREYYHTTKQDVRQVDVEVFTR